MRNNHMKPVPRLIISVLAFFVLSGFIYFSSTVDHLPLETPKLKDGETYLHHLAYGFVYDEAHEQAKWVAYSLTKKEAMGSLERSDQFKEDPIVPTGTATNADYAKSGFDRGHLAPAADMRWSTQSMDESFYYSNMSPQVPAFNRGIWKKLEEQVRDWAISMDSILIVTGPILEPNLPSIGKNKVSVPKYYFKAILDFKGSHSKAIAFVLPNEGSKLPLMDFALTIDELEHRTNMDFFYQLADDLEQKIESSNCKTCWP
jgi:endonuclease G